MVAIMHGFVPGWVIALRGLVPVCGMLMHGFVPMWGMTMRGLLPVCITIMHGFGYSNAWFLHHTARHWARMGYSYAWLGAGFWRIGAQVWASMALSNARFCSEIK
jgi:hypothetical protein